MLADLLDDAPADVLAGFDFKAQGVWAFARPGSPPLKATESLDDAGVVDGALLTLVSVSRTERYRPLVEDVIDAIAVLDESPEFDRPALNRFVGLAIPLVTFTITGIALWTWSDTGHGWWWALALGLLGLAVLGGSLLAQNRYQNVDLAESLLVAALPLLAGAAALAVPLPRGIDGLGAPQLAGAAAVVLLVVLATRGGPRKRAEVASFLAVLCDRGDRGRDRLRLRLAGVGAGRRDRIRTYRRDQRGQADGCRGANCAAARSRLPVSRCRNDELLDPVAAPAISPMRSRRLGRPSSIRCPSRPHV